ncbi:MAG: sigma 54-interacting transcriptional regulator [Polyangiaceae bacterium]
MSGDGVTLVLDQLAPASTRLIRKSASAARAREALRLEVDFALERELPALPRVVALVTDAARDTVFFEEAVGAPLTTLKARSSTWTAIAIDLLRALGAAHDAGFVHGDLKPEHVVIGRDRDERRLYLLDWGLACPIGQPARGGSAGFLAPELLEGAPVSAASDLYAWAATLRAVLPPTDVPAALERELRRSLEPDPRKRPSSAWAVIAALGGVGGRGAPELPSALEAPSLDGRVIGVTGARGSGLTDMALALHRATLRRRAGVLALEAHGGFNTVQRIADLLGVPRRLDLEARAARTGTSLAKMGALVIFDGVDRLDDDGVASLVGFARALRAAAQGALVLLGRDGAWCAELGSLIAERVELRALDEQGVKRALEANGARADERTTREVLATTGGRRAIVARVAHELARRPELAVADALPVEATEEPTTRKNDATAPLVRARELLDSGAPRAAADLLRTTSSDKTTASEHALLLGRAEFAAGRLREAEKVLVTRTAPHEEEARLWLARVCERLAEHTKAKAAAESVLATARGSRRAEAAMVAAQSTLALGDPVAAGALAERGVADAEDAAVRARLLALASDAALRGHDVERALEYADKSVTEAATSADASAIAHALSRVASAHALSGAPSKARRAASDALAQAEAAGDVTALPPFVMNLAAAEHALGEYAAAVAGYERAAHLAERLGRTGSLAAALTNLGGLLASLGGLEEARAVLGRAREAAERAGVRIFGAQTDLIEAETWLERDLARARALASRAAQAFDAIGAARQKTEALVLTAELDLRAGDASRARSDASRLDGDARRAGLGPRLDLLDGEARLRLGEHDGARRAIEHALAGARQAADKPLELRALELMANLHDALGTGAGESYRDEARRVAAELATRIPSGLRERFVEAHVRAKPQRAEGPRLGVDGRRLLRLVGRALREANEDKVIETALDEAVAMTRAEHAFLLRRTEGGKPVVAAARNLDRETVKNSRFRFSRSVAERVLKSGEPVVTASAPTDPLLGQAKSVLDLGLLSVLSVPVRAESGVIAALYLDHRFEHGRFTDDDREVIQALADVVGLALEQARLRRAAEARNDELERARASLELEGKQKDAELTRLLDALAKSPQRAGDGPIVGRSAALGVQLDVARRVAKTDLSVLIEGESGTGKELFARLVHDASPRKAGPFVAINCGALPESLIESELFGHVRGAFTGATRDHAGVFRAARGGTLFLDEIGELPAPVQTRLLRVLQERVVTSVGSARGEAVDVRVVAATNRDLDREVERGTFRSDLFFRLAGVRLKLPPLRRRTEDILPIADALLERLAREPGLRRVTLSRSAAQALVEHAWPGNVRELEHALRRAVALSDGPELEASHFELRAHVEPRSRKDARSKLDQEVVARALVLAKGNRTEAARALGVSRVTLQRLLRSLDAIPPGTRGRPRRARSA